MPFAPGGPTDATGRLVAEGLAARLGQRFLVENVSGAGSSIGSARVARAAPDGHVLLVNHLALLGSAALQANLPYDTATAFAPVGLINYGPMILIGGRDLPPRDVGSAFAWIRGRGDRVTLGHVGTGPALHLCGLLVQHRLGTRFTEIGYRGSAPAFQDMLGGRVDVICDISTTGLPQVQAGNARAWAVTTRERLPVLPDVPTLAEAGLDGFDLVLWNALFAPAGTPRPIIERLNTALREVLAEPATLARFASFGTDTFPPAEQTPEAANTRLQAEIISIRDTLRAMGVEPERYGGKGRTRASAAPDQP
ncbi:MAG: tripartite tricarboxylate transporter substrate-binding protein [Roseococcus sp.]